MRLTSSLNVGTFTVGKTSKQYLSVLEVTNDEQNREIKIAVQEDGGTHSWKAHMNSNAISNWVEKTGISHEKYIEETVSALTGRSHNARYIVELTSKNDADDGEMELSWKKQLAEDEILFKLGSISLKPIGTSSHMLKMCIETINTLQKELSQEKQAKEEFETQNVQLLTKLEECCSAKQRMESELFTKFSQVINEKKRKIKELQETKTEVTEKLPRNSEIVVKKEVGSKDDQFLLDPESQEEDPGPILPRSSRSKQKLVLKQAPVAAIKIPEAEVYEADDDDETLVMDSEDLLHNFD